MLGNFIRLWLPQGIREYYTYLVIGILSIFLIMAIAVAIYEFKKR